jgi:hypothetical protein
MRVRVGASVNTAEVYLAESSTSAPDDWVSIRSPPGELDKRGIHGAIDEMIPITKWDGEVNGASSIFIVNPSMRSYTWH